MEGLKDLVEMDIILTPSNPVSIVMKLLKTRVTKNVFFPLCFYIGEESESV